MDPALVDQAALAADTARAKNQLALQAQIDPALAAQRGASENLISQQLGQIGNAPSDQVAHQATTYAQNGITGQPAGINSLQSQANDLLSQGTSIPADVQAQLVQSRLEQAG